MTALFANNASSRTPADITAAQTSLTVMPGEGAKFPVPSDGDYCMVTIEDRRTGQLEICRCTGRSGDQLTVIRAQEGTPAQSFFLGATISNRLTAGTILNFAGVPEAPVDGKIYGRQDSAWVETITRDDFEDQILYQEGVDGSQSTAITNLQSDVVRIDGVNDSQDDAIVSLGGDISRIDNVNDSQDVALVALSDDVDRIDDTNTAQDAAIASKIGDAPSDGKIYGRKDANWTEVVSGGGGASVSTSDTPPAAPRDGDMWWETDTGKLYIFFDDGNSQQWVQPQGAPGAKGDKGDPGKDAVKTAQTRNRVVNPAMQISQENGNAAGTVSLYYAADQWHSAFFSSSTITVQRQTLPLRPNGSLVIVATPAETAAAAAEFVTLAHKLEGNSIADFIFGTTNSRQVVIAFDVHVPVAGTYWVSFVNGTATHTWLGSYTISAAEVSEWVRKTIVIPAGVLDAGTWSTDNTLGAYLRFNFHCGPSLVGVAGFQAGNLHAGPNQALGLSTTASACYLTNVGLYLDPDNTGIAPPWQMPDEADELQRCCRYFYRANNPACAYGYRHATAAFTLMDAGTIPLPVSMRAAPTIAVITAPTLSNCSALSFTSELAAPYTSVSSRVTVTAAGAYRHISGVFDINARM